MPQRPPRLPVLLIGQRPNRAPPRFPDKTAAARHSLPSVVPMHGAIAIAALVAVVTSVTGVQGQAWLNDCERLSPTSTQPCRCRGSARVLADTEWVPSTCAAIASFRQQLKERCQRRYFLLAERIPHFASCARPLLEDRATLEALKCGTGALNQQQRQMLQQQTLKLPELCLLAHREAYNCAAGDAVCASQLLWRTIVAQVALIGLAFAATVLVAALWEAVEHVKAGRRLRAKQSGQRVGLTMRESVAQSLASGGMGHAVEIVPLVASSITCINFVLFRYFTTLPQMDSYPDLLYAMDIMCSATIAAAYALGMLLAPRKLVYVLSPIALVDLVTVVPTLTLWATGKEFVGFPFLRFLRLMRMATALSRVRLVDEDDKIAMKTITILLTLAAVVYCGACFVMVVEEVGDPPVVTTSGEWGSNQRFTMHEALYFMVVTLTTVGYGDYTPITFFGRLVNVLMIAAAAVFLPMQANQLTELYKTVGTPRMKRYTGRRGRHVVVIGELSSTSCVEFLHEFFHPEHGGGAPKLVLLNTGPPAPRLQALISSVPQFAGTLYLEGDAMQVGDLLRARVPSAVAVFLLCKQYAPVAAGTEDNKAAMCAMLVRKVAPECRLLVQLLSNTYTGALRSLGGMDDDSIMRASELRQQILAKSCACPGFSTLVSNLCLSDSGPASQQQSASEAEFQYGSMMEVHNRELGAWFDGKVFHEAVASVWEVTGAILVGMQVLGEPEATMFTPAEQVMQAGDHGIFIAADSTHAAMAASMANAGDQQRERLPLSSVAILQTELAGVLPGGYDRFVCRSSVGAASGAAAGAAVAGTLAARGASDVGWEEEQVALEESQRAVLAHAATEARRQVKELLRSIDAITTPQPPGSPVASVQQHAAIHNRWMALPKTMHDGATDVFVRSKPPTRIHKHTVVCGLPADLDLFLATLRASSLQDPGPVVILSPATPPAAEWERVQRNHRNVYFVEGRAVEEHALQRARISQAAVVLIMAHNSAAAEQDDTLISDAPVILAFNMIVNLVRKSAHVMAELAHPSNGKFLGERAVLITAAQYASLERLARPARNSVLPLDDSLASLVSMHKAGLAHARSPTRPLAALDEGSGSDDKDEDDEAAPPETHKYELMQRRGLKQGDSKPEEEQGLNSLLSSYMSGQFFSASLFTGITAQVRFAASPRPPTSAHHAINGSHASRATCCRSWCESATRMCC